MSVRSHRVAAAASPLGCVLALLTLLPLVPGCSDWQTPARHRFEPRPTNRPVIPPAGKEAGAGAGSRGVHAEHHLDKQHVPPALEENGEPCDDPVEHDAPLIVGRRTNVMGSRLRSCSTQPLTGWFRDGTCRTDERDRGMHVVCAEMTEGFLAFTKEQGNDLSTPNVATHFPGLNPGDRWCVCAARWEEARRAGHAPRVVMEATASKALQIVSAEKLAEYSTTTRAARVEKAGLPPETISSDEAKKDEAR